MTEGPYDFSGKSYGHDYINVSCQATNPHKTLGKTSSGKKTTTTVISGRSAHSPVSTHK